MIALPTDHTHLDPARLNAGRPAVSTASRAEAFVHEAASWVESVDSSEPLRPSIPPGPRAPHAAEPLRARILVADDNADMRDYVSRILRGRFVVDAVADGQAALHAAQKQLPDLIVSDVMMPILDGFALLRELKPDPATSGIPVILLSARAGEEATLEGLRAGASDYMVKPFSARELSARVEGAIRTARAQLETTRERARLSAVFAALHEGIIVQDAEGVAHYCNAASERLLGLTQAQLAGRTSTDPRWGAIFEDGTPAAGEQHAPMLALNTRQPAVGQILGVRHPDGSLVWLRANAQPIFEEDGHVLGVVSSFFDITNDREAAREARERSEFEQQLIGIVSHDLRNPLHAVVLGQARLRAATHAQRARSRCVRAARARRAAQRVSGARHRLSGSGCVARHVGRGPSDADRAQPGDQRAQIRLAR